MSLKLLLEKLETSTIWCDHLAPVVVSTSNCDRLDEFTVFSKAELIQSGKFIKRGVAKYKFALRRKDLFYLHHISFNDKHPLLLMSDVIKLVSRLDENRPALLMRCKEQKERSCTLKRRIDGIDDSEFIGYQLFLSLENHQAYQNHVNLNRFSIKRINRCIFYDNYYKIPKDIAKRLYKSSDVAHEFWMHTNSDIFIDCHLR